MIYNLRKISCDKNRVFLRKLTWQKKENDKFLFYPARKDKTKAVGKPLTCERKRKLLKRRPLFFFPHKHNFLHYYCTVLSVPHLLYVNASFPFTSNAWTKIDLYHLPIMLLNLICGSTVYTSLAHQANLNLLFLHRSGFTHLSCSDPDSISHSLCSSLLVIPIYF